MSDNSIVELYIEDMSIEGQGVGRIKTSDGKWATGSKGGQRIVPEGLVVFVEGAVKGDLVRAEITRTRKSFAFAKAIETLEESPLRNKEFDCPYREQGCGGCPLGELDYEAQLKIKEKQVRDRLERIAGVELVSEGDLKDGASIHPIIGMRDEDDRGQGPWRYRNKAVMRISTGGLMTKKGGVQEPVHEPRIGFYQSRTHHIVDCSDCPLQTGTAMAAAEATRQFMAEDNICSYDDRWDKGLMKQMTVRTAFGTGEVMVTYDINGKGIPNAAKLVEYLDDAIYEAGGSLESVVIRRDNKTETIAGKNTITDTVVIDDEEPVELRFEISANSFYQVNHHQMERLYAIVRRYCKEACSAKGNAPVLLDLYCGIGSIGLCCADIADSIIGIESVKDAVTDANRNAVINGIVNARFICGKAEEVLPACMLDGDNSTDDPIRKSLSGMSGHKGGDRIDQEVLAQIRSADIAILDPPRAGCREELLDAVAFAKISNVIYVSCDPATLARDVRILTERGYSLVEATPVDLFPHTNHVETVCLMSRVK